MEVTEIPFNHHLGLQSTKADGVPAVSLDPRPEFLNHLGTIHASVLYAVGEAAAGAAMLASFPEMEHRAVPVLRSAKTKYRNPANAGQPVIAVGAVSSEAAASFRQLFQQRGRALLDIPVRITQESSEVFRCTFTFFISATE